MMNLYAHSDKMAVEFARHYHKLLSTIVFEQDQPDMVRLVLQLLSSQFKKGTLDVSVAGVILNKIDKLITSNSYRQILTENKSKILIQFAKIIEQLIDNREHRQEIIEMV